MSGEDYLELFKTASSQWLCDPYSIEIRFVAKKAPDFDRLLACTVNFWPIGTLPSESLRVNANDVLAGRERITDCSLKELNAFIVNLEQGKLVLKDNSYFIEAKAGLSYYSEMISNDRWFCDAHLIINGDAQNQFSSTEITKINSELRLAELPFDGVQDLLNYLNLPDILSSHKQTHIEIRIFPPVDILGDQSSLSNEQLRLVVHAHPKLDTKTISLAIQEFPESQSSRKQLASQIEWNLADGRQVGSLNIKATNAFAVKTVLMAGRNTVRRQFFEDSKRVPNRRLAAFEKFDVNLKMLKRGLIDPDSTSFEIAVNSLAYLLGFSGSIMNETDAPDILLSSPNENIVLIECTTRIKDFSAKLGKLVDRKNSLLSLLAETNDSRKVYSYLICGLPKSNIAYDEVELAKHKVVLLTKESLDNLLNQLKFPKDLEQLLIQDEQNLESVTQKTLQSSLFSQ